MMFIETKVMKARIYCISDTGRMMTFTMRLRARGIAASTTASATSSAVEKPDHERLRGQSDARAIATRSNLAWLHCLRCVHRRWQSESRHHPGKRPRTCLAVKTL
jgi:hypothetical protein